MKNLYGKKTSLFPLIPSDMEYFFKLLQHEGELMGQAHFKSPDAYCAYVMSQIMSGMWAVWCIWNKNGKASKKIGFTILSDITPSSVTVQGLLDKSMLKGLAQLLQREDKYTFSEDALRVILKHCFDDLNLHRVQAETISSNKLSRRLLEKVGFKKDGKRREAYQTNGAFDDIFVYGLLKTDKENQHDGK